MRGVTGCDVAAGVGCMAEEYHCAPPLLTRHAVKDISLLHVGHLLHQGELAFRGLEEQCGTALLDDDCSFPRKLLFDYRTQLEIFAHLSPEFAISISDGAAGGDRTHDPWLRRPILYPLSYSRTISLPSV